MDLHKTNKVHRNCWVDFCRFIASLIIVLVHFGILGSIKFWGGAVFVEFFFLLSGYYALVYMDRQSGDKIYSIANYMKKLYLKILPYIIIASVLAYALPEESFRVKAKSVLFMPFEVMLLHISGAGILKLGALWYLSALFVCLPAFMYFYTEHKKYFLFICPSLPWLLHGYLLGTYGTIRVQFSHPVILARVIGDLFFSGLLFSTSKYLKTIRFTSMGKTMLFFLEVSTWLMAFYITQVQSFAKTRYEEVFVFLMLISLTITLSEQTITSMLTGRGFTYLGKLSLPIYCLHYPVFNWLNKYVYKEGFVGNGEIWSGVTITVVFSMVSLYLVERYGPHVYIKLKKVFIK